MNSSDNLSQLIVLDFSLTCESKHNTAILTFLTARSTCIAGSVSVSRSRLASISLRSVSAIVLLL